MLKGIQNAAKSATKNAKPAVKPSNVQQAPVLLKGVKTNNLKQPVADVAKFATKAVK